MPHLDARAIAHVARNDLLLMRRDRGAIFWSFVGPFMFVVFFGLMFGPRDSQEAKTVLYLKNEDAAGQLATALDVLLRDSGLDVKRDAAPERAYQLLVPAHATDSLVAGRLPQLVLRSPEEDPSPKEHMLLAQIQRCVMSAFLGLTPAELHGRLTEPEIRARVALEPTLRLVKRELPLAQPSAGFQHTVPAYLIMFLLMSLLTYGAGILVSERRSGHLRRVLASALTPGQVVLGKFASRFAWAWLQIVWMLLVGIVIFKVRFGAHPGTLFVVLTAFALCATSMGLLFATLFDSPDKAGGMGSLVTMMMAALGGCWWPLEIVPGWMRTLAFALPTGWGFDALNRVMALDANLPQVATHVLVLLAISAACLPLAAKRLPRVR